MKGRNIHSVIFLPILLLFCAACSNTKHLPANEALYTGAKISIDSSAATSKEKKTIRHQLLLLTRPKPNSKILGMRVRLFFYNLAGHPKREKSPAGLLKNKLGEPPVLLSSLNLDYNAKVLTGYLQNRGYFNAEVTGDTVIKNKKASATYHVITGPQYHIRQVSFMQDSGTLESAIRESSPASVLRKGNPYNFDLVKVERERIDADLKESGFYYFNPNYLLVDIDSTVGNRQVDLFVHLKKETAPDARRIFTIHNVYVYTNYSLRQTAGDTSKKFAQYFDGYYVVDSAHLYKPRLFEQSLQFATGDLYNRTDHNLSLNRLINLGLFKFVKNRFENVSTADSAKLDTYYYLTPQPKKSIRLEINGNTKSDNLTGSQVTLGWRNRNTFRGGELLTIDAYGGFEIQYSALLKGYNTYRWGLDTKLAFPRFLIPFVNLEGRGGYVPKTTVELGYDFLNKRKLYTLNSVHAGFGYEWKENIRKEHQFNPISITFVQPLDVTTQYSDSAIKNPTLRKAIERQFILGSNYNFNYNQLAGNKKKKDAIYFNGNLDLSGNIAGLVTGANVKRGDTVTIFNAAFSQYVRTEADFRYYHTMGDVTWASRIILGFGLPYGNSSSLPFIKQFFIGGNNSVRAFRSRSVGPGIYQPPANNNFLPDQSGDIKLELNTELRAKLFSIVNGAIFIDAGNIWLYNKDPEKPGGEFSKDFLKQLAVGTGLGLRFDVSILVLRLDVAFPLRIPYLPEGQRWVLSQVDLGSGTWRKNNLVYNIGIGYPF